jgi:hypothetical protein
MVRNLNSYINSNYVTGVSLEDGVKYEKIVDYVDEVHFPDDEKPTSVLVFKDGTRLALNQTNLKTVIRAHGPNPDNVAGKPIILFRKMVQFGGDEVPGVRIECIVPERYPAVTAARRAAIGNDPPAPPSEAAPPPWDEGDAWEPDEGVGASH